MLFDLWQRVLAPQPPPSPPVAAAAVAAAALLVLSPRAWRIARHVVTIAHEGAHGIAAWATGRRLQGIRLHSDTSGLTVSAGKRTGFGLVVTAAAGYVGPALLGLGAAFLLGTGRALAVLWAVVALLVLMLVQIRNWFGLWLISVAGVAVLAASWWLPAPWQVAAAYVITWFLLLAAPRPVLELLAGRGRSRARNSDADLLGRLTHLPPLVWIVILLAATLGALGAGGLIVMG